MIVPGLARLGRLQDLEGQVEGDFLAVKPLGARDLTPVFTGIELIMDPNDAGSSLALSKQGGSGGGLETLHLWHSGCSRPSGCLQKVFFEMAQKELMSEQKGTSKSI